MAAAKLPSRFSVAMPDNSLAGSVEKGTVLYFETDAAPEPGDGILISDRDGRWYIRRYVMRGSAWLAESPNNAYATLEPQRDGLTILATMRGRMSGKI